MTKEIHITKASGEQSIFSEEKLKASLTRAGADEEQIISIINDIRSRLYEGIATKKIYRLAFSMLKERSRHLAARYHLKRAIMELGPSGYPFETFMGEILKHQGYKVKTGEIIAGNCVNHEVDVIAEKENDCFLVECKYHNQPGIVCDVKIPLYIFARFKDIESQWLKSGEHRGKNCRGWVATNTRFSSDAIKYATCAGLGLIGWDYPIKGSLKDRIDTLGLYPITCLTSLTKVLKQRLLDNKIVLCKELHDNRTILDKLNIKPSLKHTVILEVEQLCEQLLNGKV